MLHNHLHVNVQEQCFRLEINSDSFSNLEKKDTKVTGIYISYKCTVKVAIKGFFAARRDEKQMYLKMSFIVNIRCLVSL